MIFPFLNPCWLLPNLFFYIKMVFRIICSILPRDEGEVNVPVVPWILLFALLEYRRDIRSVNTLPASNSFRRRRLLSLGCVLPLFNLCLTSLQRFLTPFHLAWRWCICLLILFVSLFFPNPSFTLILFAFDFYEHYNFWSLKRSSFIPLLALVCPTCIYCASLVSCLREEEHYQTQC